MLSLIHISADGSLGVPGGNLPVFLPNPATGELVSSGFAYFPGLNLDYKVGTVYSGGIQAVSYTHLDTVEKGYFPFETENRAGFIGYWYVSLLDEYGVLLYLRENPCLSLSEEQYTFVENLLKSVEKRINRENICLLYTSRCV